MRKTISLKFPIEDPTRMLVLMRVYTEIFNDHIEWALKNKTYSKQKAHEQLYAQLRIKYAGFPSGLLQAARDNALEAVKATKFKRKPHKKGFATIRYDKRTSALRGKQLTISCIGKRLQTILDVPEYFAEVFNTWEFTGCTLSLKKNGFYVHLNYFKENPDETTNKRIIGVDRGIYNIATTSDGERFSGNRVRAIRRRYLFNRSSLQKKGTRSAKRRLRAMSGREKRFVRQENHVISKQIALSDAGVFVLEKLSKINKRQGKISNKWLSNWSFFQLEFFLKYKAELLGKRIEFVGPEYTSQTCNCCGHVSKENRKKSRFVCIRCGHKEHADINAARNIREKYISGLVVGAGGCQPPVCSLTDAGL